MNPDALEGAKRLADAARRHMPNLIEKIRYRIKPIDLGACYSSLAGDHRSLAMYAKYIEANDEQFRQHLYVACKLKVESIRLNDYQRFGTGSELFDALLSDSSELIDLMARFEPAYYASHRHDPLNAQFDVHMWQLAILGDDGALEAKIEKLAKNGRKPMRGLCAEKKDFFSLLLRADKAGLEARISEDAKFRNDDPVTSEFFTHLATLEAKLCWRKGIEVQIDNARVPMDLMPVRPLAHYDDVYDFLKPGWVPPPHGLLARVSRWLR